MKITTTLSAAAALLILTGCGPTASDLTAPPETPAATASQEAMAEVPRQDLLEEFNTSPQGEPWAGTVTQLEKIGPSSEGSVPVYVATTVGVDSPETAVAVCQAVKDSLTDGTEQVNVLAAAGNFLATTTGEEQTCSPEAP